MANDISALVLIIGIGNLDRGDDGVGILTVERLRVQTSNDVQIMQHSGECTGLIDLWRTNLDAAVYIVDAMYSGLPVGSIRSFDAHYEPLPACFSRNTSTHAFGVAEAVELARSLVCLPRKLIIYGIEGQCFDLATPISAQVEAASRVIGHILENIIAFGEITGSNNI